MNETVQAATPFVIDEATLREMDAMSMTTNKTVAMPPIVLRHLVDVYMRSAKFFQENEELRERAAFLTGEIESRAYDMPPDGIDLSKALTVRPRDGIRGTVPQKLVEAVLGHYFEDYADTPRIIAAASLIAEIVVMNASSLYRRGRASVIAGTERKT